MVLQGSPVLPILFAIYISDFFRAVLTGVPGIQATSSTDDFWFTIEEESILEVATKLQKTGVAAIDWGKKNPLAFDLGKEEAILSDKTLK